VGDRLIDDDEVEEEPHVPAEEAPRHREGVIGKREIYGEAHGDTQEEPPMDPDKTSKPWPVYGRGMLVRRYFFRFAMAGFETESFCFLKPGATRRSVRLP
jgi:hypothetical protein